MLLVDTNLHSKCLETSALIIILQLISSLGIITSEMLIIKVYLFIYTLLIGI